MTDSNTVIAHAFPHIEQRDGYNVYHPGLTKREYFAAMAMQGLLASPKYPDGLGHVGTDAVKFADDLIAALAK
jgi:hypothetical protein